MNKLSTLGLVLILSFIIANRFALFVPEVAVAATCDDFKSFESGDKKNLLLELYTSEGCSSCPPAEKWVNSLYKNPKLYKEFIPIAFHVDYWNYIGHVDPLSKSSFSQRQRSYASEWGSRSVYTPGFVLDGSEWRSIVRSVPKGSSEKVGNLKVSRKDNLNYEIYFDTKEDLTIFGVILDHGIVHEIKKGENRGKTLKHNFVVNTLKKTKLKNGKGQLEFGKIEERGMDHSVVFWVTKGKSLRPIQAAGHCLKI